MKCIVTPYSSLHKQKILINYNISLQQPGKVNYDYVECSFPMYRYIGTLLVYNHMYGRF